MRLIGSIAAGAFAALSLHSYLTTPWAPAGIAMGNRTDCIAWELKGQRLWNLQSCL